MVLTSRGVEGEGDVYYFGGGGFCGVDNAFKPHVLDTDDDASLNTDDTSNDDASVASLNSDEAQLFEDYFLKL